MSAKWRNIASRFASCFKGDQLYARWQDNPSDTIYAPNFQRIQELFISQHVAKLAHHGEHGRHVSGRTAMAGTQALRAAKKILYRHSSLVGEGSISQLRRRPTSIG